MLRRSNAGRITHTPFADFPALTRERYVLPANPTRITAAEESAAEHMRLAGGHEKVVTPSRYLYPGAGSARRVWRPLVEVEFPDVMPAEFIRQLREMQHRGQRVAFWIPGLDEPRGGLPIHRRFLDKMWTEEGTYYYTNALPWSEKGLRLYDAAGNLIYENTGSGNDGNAYGIALDGGHGRISRGSTGPQDYYASYDRLVYGHIVSISVDPVPAGQYARFGPSVAIQEIDFPVVTRTNKLYFTKTAAAVDGLAAETASSQTPSGWMGSVGLYDMDPQFVLAPQSVGQFKVGKDLDYQYDLFGVFVSPPLADQIIAAGTKCSLGLCYANGYPETDHLWPHGFVYLWRPGIGIVAVLSNTSYDLSIRGGAPGRIHYIADWYTTGAVIGPPIGDCVDVFDGDRIVAEVWGYFNLPMESPDKNTVAYGFGGTGLSLPPAQNVVLDDTVGFVEFSNTLYVLEQG